MTFGKPGRPPEDRLARQREIYTAVAPLILTYGARGFTMREAAHAASLSVGGLYHYFRTKRDLVLHGLAYDSRRRLHLEGRDALQRLGRLDCEARLHAYIEHTLTMWAFVHPSAQAALQLGHDEFLARLEEGFAASDDELANLLRLAVPDASGEQLPELVRAIRRLALGTVVEQHFDCEATRATLQAILNGAGKPSGITDLE